MNWYANEMLINETLHELQHEREMDRLAHIAQGEDEGVGVEDVGAARALISHLFIREVRADFASRLRLPNRR
jgi:hypothetical protein